MAKTDVHQAGDLATLASSMKGVRAEDVARARELTGWADIAHVLRSKDFEPPSGEDGFGVDFQTRVLGDSLVELRGDHHFERRRLVSILFRRGTLLGYEERPVRPAVAESIAALRATPDPDGVVRTDLLGFGHRVSLRLMTTLLGFDGIDTPEEVESFSQLFDAVDVGARAKYTTLDPEEVVQAALAAQRQIMDAYFWPAWERREQLRAAGEELPKDLISVMVSHPEHFGQFERGAVEREASLFIIASVVTTANEICHAVREIEGWIAEHPEDADLRTDEAFVVAAFQESARLHAFGWMVRAAVRDTTLRDGTALHEHDIVWLNFRTAYAELYGADADRFNPRRAQSDALSPYGLAFGDGRHTSSGRCSSSATPGSTSARGRPGRSSSSSTARGCGSTPTTRRSSTRARSGR